MKRILLTFLLLAGLSFMACDRTDDTGGAGGRGYFVVNDISSWLATLEDEQRFEAIVFDSQWQGDTLPVNQVYINVDIDDIEYVRNTSGQTWGAAYADIAPPLLKHSLSSISITSNKKVETSGTVYQAGAELVDLYYFGYRWLDQWITVEEYLKDEEALSYERTLSMRMEASLVEHLDQEFTITLGFKDGSTVSTTTTRLVAK